MTSVIVLCGGLGTRMGKAAAHRQKTMSEVCGTPLLELVLTQVCAAVPAPAPVVLLTGHRGTDVAAAVPDWHTRVDARIRAVAEFAPGAVGVLQLAERLPAPILIIAGNVLLDYSRLLPPMLQQWATDGRPVTAGKANILRQVEDSDPDDPFVRGLRDRYSEIDGERQTALAAVSEGGMRVHRSFVVT
ncbi:NTP transferase domain-containing protein [Streptomyces albicerus]|uniref:NTP transferase domain-containing protein n=1 Tax=Streptomyces albicerus TaxID=2569859 RepID=UPI00124B0BA7|nr:NTP transferase domain-containing protein [Streptomyces albicerus]